MVTGIWNDGPLTTVTIGPLRPSVMTTRWPCAKPKPSAVTVLPAGPLFGLSAKTALTLQAAAVMGAIVIAATAAISIAIDRNARSPPGPHASPMCELATVSATHATRAGQSMQSLAQDEHR